METRSETTNGAKTASNTQDRATVLIVEDEIGPRESLKLVLSAAYNIILARNGEEGIAQFQECRPDLVISDIRMPRLDGIGLMRQIKQKAPDTPFIILTGYGSLETAQEAVRNGAFDYISKPYDIEHLRALVRQAIASKQESQQKEKATERLHSMNSQLQEQITELSKQASVGEISAQMVHDLNNPLFVLQGYINLLEEKIDEEDEHNERHEEREYVDTIRQQVDCCARLTKGFLSYARNADSPPSETDINQLIEDTLLLLRIRFEKANIEITKHLSEHLPPILIEKAALQQVIYNLLLNALQVMEANGGNLTIETGRRHPEQDRGGQPQLHIGIHDTGPGIPKDQIDRIFTPYFTTKANGTGLGLAICKRIIAEHSGRIDVNTETEVGTSFHVYLPLHG